MSFNFNGLSGAAVQVSGTITTTPTKNTATVLSTAVIASATTTDIGTVGVGKRWRILSINITGYVNLDAGAEQYAYVDLAGVKALDLLIAGKTITVGNNSSSVKWDYDSCPVLAAGEKARLITGTSFKCAANISYVEESV